MTRRWLGELVAVVVIHMLILFTFVISLTVVVDALNPEMMPYLPWAMCLPAWREASWLAKALEGGK